MKKKIWLLLGVLMGLLPAHALSRISGADPGYLTLEVTEGLMIDNLGEVIARMGELARHLHLQVVAEGVETEAQAAFLNARGKVIHQGYLYGRPEPAETWIARWKGGA